MSVQHVGKERLVERLRGGKEREQALVCMHWGQGVDMSCLSQSALYFKLFYYKVILVFFCFCFLLLFLVLFCFV